MRHTPDYGSMAEKGELYQTLQAHKTTSLPNLADWMSFLPDRIPVSGLSIPGTHDSAAFMSSWPYISTQTLTTTQQLEAGIRYFDLRCGIIKDEMEMVHGRAVLGLKLHKLLTDMYTFLEKHPGEAIIVQLKQDRKDENSTLTFAQLFLTLISQNAKSWRLDSTTPTLGELRGRIQLLRRFTGKNIWGCGIDVSHWPDNPILPFTVRTHSGVHLTIQDHYSYSTPESLPSLISKKGGDISSTLTRAINDTETWHWYINFCSAFEFNVVYQIPPKQIAIGGYWLFRWVEGINLRLNNYLKLRVGEKQGRRQRFGVLMLDFPEAPQEDLIATVIGSNFGLDKEESDGQGKKRLKGLGVRIAGLLVLLLVFLVFAAVLGCELRRSEDVAGHWCPRSMQACSLRSIYEISTA